MSLYNNLYISRELPKDESYPESCLYWIKLPEHTDPRSQGYIGVSVSGASRRMSKHKWDANNGSDFVVHRAMRKYGDKIELITLLEADQEFCLMVERELRPTYRTAGTWNMSAGGELSQLGCKQSPERIEKRVSKLRGKIRTKEQREAMSKAFTGVKRQQSTRDAMSARRKGAVVSDQTKERIRDAHLLKNSQTPAWGHPASKVEAWKMAIDAFDYLTKFPETKPPSLAKYLGIHRNSIATMWTKLKDGWNPNVDLEYKNWLKEQQC